MDEKKIPKFTMRFYEENTISYVKDKDIDERRMITEIMNKLSEYNISVKSAIFILQQCIDKIDGLMADEYR